MSRAPRMRSRMTISRVGTAGVGDDAAVEHLDLARQPRGEVAVVGDHDDRRSVGVELPRAARGSRRRWRCRGCRSARRRARSRAGRRAHARSRRADARRPRAASAGTRPDGRDRPGERLGRLRAPLASARAGVEQPVGDVLERRRVLGQEELLEHEPDARGAQRRELAIATAARRRGRSARTVPELGRSSVPIRCSNVDFPDPTGRRSPPARRGAR